ncbi:YggS family pyridoxal phosphate-dependent enzyme [Picosynechococcus sp. NKBG15041c]|uniref:YggS family pyridoxal phosphate-dependent enzyme n=1 Tax=Picosynechococcus sp. NKBG15041c TaxID=1407650 RepID=UPI0003F94E9C|nr:YggS family pyridoxal phosphate-dependent enzyme [Picosynechococcus sp. NKBG15041c]
MANAIAQNIIHLQEALPAQVRLIAVSKTHSAAKIRLAYAAGIRDFGENRLQEALEKQAELQDLPDICWHFIGHLQKNKAKKAIAHFDWIHTIDSLDLAQKLNQYAADVENPANCCLQIKPLPDPNKFGWEIPQLFAELPELAACEHLKIQGLMTILPRGLGEQATQAAFQQVADLRDQLNQTTGFPFLLTELSMGMSGDYSLAIRAGATMIRLGQRIFGDRDQ